MNLNSIHNSSMRKLPTTYQLPPEQSPLYAAEMSKRLVLPFMAERILFRELVQGFIDCAFQLKYLLAQNKVRAGLVRAIGKGHKLGRSPKHGKNAKKIIELIVKRSREGWSLSRIAKAVNLSRSRISQILEKTRTQ